MRPLLYAALFLRMLPSALSQTPSTQAVTPPAAIVPLPTDPRALIAAAAPFYDFNSPDLKPWHLKASYQLYDDKGAPAETGTFEYWWASPKVSHLAWTRGDSAHSTWDTADGKHAHSGKGGPLKYFEFKLRDALLSPLPGAIEMDSARNTLQKQTVPLGTARVACVMAAPEMSYGGMKPRVPLGLFPTYCFDPDKPILRLSYSLGSVVVQYNRIAKVQGRYLAQDVTFYQGKQKLLSATVDSVTGIAATDAALTPPSDLPQSGMRKVTVSGGVAQGMLLRKVNPVYPQDAKDNRIKGTVVLQATIGTDGSIHDLHVVSAPWPSMAAASLWAVSHWEYRPYLLNGDPVEVETTINCVFNFD